MTRHSYREHDYTFGQAMQKLRTSVGLTQAGMADLLGVSRRAVGEWEAGSNYPKAEHLQHLLGLCVQQRVFAPGREEEEIRALWKTAHQRVILDETWLRALLSTHTTPLFTSTTGVRATPGQTPAMESAAFPRIDWSGALDVSGFRGREGELAEISRWLLQGRCRMVAVLGMGGIGKSALVSMVGHQFATHFDAVLWRSLRDAPFCDDLVADCIIFFSEAPPAELPASLERRIDQLVERLQMRRCLLVLDNLEMLLEEGDVEGRYRTGYAGYGRLIQRLAESAHQSCVLVTSREKPREISPLEGSHSPVHSLHLAGVDETVARALLSDKDLVGEEDSWRQLIATYVGNPLALKIVAQTIVDLFDSDITQFLQSGELVFNGIRAVLHQQVRRLTPLEQVLLTGLAVGREWVSLDALLQFVIPGVVRGRALEALEALQGRSLLERGHQGMFTLQSVVMEYVTDALIEQIAAEMITGEVEALRRYALEQAQAKDYVREIQVRLLVRPLLERLRAELEQDRLIEERLLQLLDRFRTEDSMKQGYGPANVISVLKELRGDLHGLDLSRLSIRGAYLQGIQMQDATLAGAHLHEVVFTDAFDVVISVAVSPDGRYWAVGSNSGQVRVWREHGRTAHLMLRAHTDRLGAVAFSPDGRTLASASWDGTIKLWDVVSGEAIRTLQGHDNYVTSITFSPGGRLLASGSYDGTLCIWDVNNGTSQHILREHRGPILTLDWSPDGQWLASGGTDQKIRLWNGQTGILLRAWHGHRDLVTGLAFAPDNTILASCGLDETVKVWEVRSGICRKILEGHRGLVTAVAWSADGQILASCGYDTTIRLWNADTGQCQHLLQGHSDAVLSLAFTSAGDTLLSGSSDRTLREWETTNGQCLRIMQGHAAIFSDVAWSPDGEDLASGGSDATLTVWSVADKTPIQVLQGHTQLVYGVAWSPAGGLLASASWDHTVLIWDMQIGVCVRILQGHMGTVSGIAWHPDGRLLASTGNDQTVRVWNVHTGVTLWVGHEHREAVNSLSWSPDGTQLASGSDDHTVLVWRATDGNILQRLHGHEGSVYKVSWSPDGTRLASCGGSERKGELFVWDTHLGTCVWRLKELDSAVLAVAWDSEGNLLVSGRSDGMLRWRDAEQGRILATVQAHDGWVRSIQVSPDGRMVASSGEDGLIKLWDTQSRRHLSTLRGNRLYERLTITGVTGLTEAQKATLRVLGAVE